MIAVETALEFARWIHISFNAVEALVWLMAAAVTARRVRRLRSSRHRIVAAIAIFALVLFSVSDWIEIFTGTWYSPPGLLALNIFCVALLVPCVVYYYRFRTPTKEP